MTNFHVSAHSWWTPLRKPLFWWALGLTIAWDALGLDRWVMAAIGTPQGFPLRNHPFVAEVLHTQLKNAMLVLYGLAWLMVFRPLGPVREFSRRQRWAAIVGVSLSLVVISSLKRFSTTSCPWDWAEFGGLAQPLSHWAWGVLDGGSGNCFPGGHVSGALAFESGLGRLECRVSHNAALGASYFVDDSGAECADGRGADPARCTPTQPYALDGLDLCCCRLGLRLDFPLLVCASVSGACSRLKTDDS